jgi:hypothetical protein
MALVHRLRTWRMRRRYRARARPPRRSHIRFASIGRKQGPEDYAWAKAQLIIAEAQEAALEMRRRALENLSPDRMVDGDTWPIAAPQATAAPEEAAATASLLARELAREIKDLSASYVARMEDLRRSLDGSSTLVGLPADADRDDDDADDDAARPDVVVDLVAHEGTVPRLRRLGQRFRTGSS